MSGECEKCGERCIDCVCSEIGYGSIYQQLGIPNFREKEMESEERLKQEKNLSLEGYGKFIIVNEESEAIVENLCPDHFNDFTDLSSLLNFSDL